MEVSTMLGKLLKYDGKSMFRIFIPLWLALLAVSVINHYTVRTSLNTAILGTLPKTISMILYVCLVVAVMVVTVALVIMRFYNGLLKSEGYLMFTLPVRPWQLITSKCILATVVTILSLLVGFLSALLIGADPGDIVYFFRALWSVRDSITGDMVLCMVLMVVLVISAVLAEITHIYASLALGHLANRHRIALAVLAYIVINTVLMVALTFLIDLSFRFNWSAMIPSVETLPGLNALLGVLSALCLVQVVIFFVITERILSKRLNLE